MLQLEKKHCLFLSVGTEIERYHPPPTHTHIYFSVLKVPSVSRLNTHHAKTQTINEPCMCFLNKNVLFLCHH